MGRSRILGVIWVLLGAMAWIGFSLYAGGGEAWDHPAYWRVGYPLLCLLAGIGGYAVPAKPQVWPFLLMGGQLLVMFGQNPSANLLPLGVLLLAIMAVPMLVPAYLGAFLRRRLVPQPGDSPRGG